MFQPKSLDRILSSFNKTVEELSQLIDHNAAKTQANSAEIKALEAQNAQLSDEANKASQVRAKINALIT